jgi:hypothetical protein
MQLLTEPRILESKVGASWLSEGFRLFHQQPLGWTLILFIYWAAATVNTRALDGIYRNLPSH